MAVTLTGDGGLFTRLGRIIKAIRNLNGFRGTTPPAYGSGATVKTLTTGGAITSLQMAPVFGGSGYPPSSHLLFYVAGGSGDALIYGLTNAAGAVTEFAIEPVFGGTSGYADADAAATSPAWAAPSWGSAGTPTIDDVQDSIDAVEDQYEEPPDLEELATILWSVKDSLIAVIGCQNQTLAQLAAKTIVGMVADDYAANGVTAGVRPRRHAADSPAHPDCADDRDGVRHSAAHHHHHADAEPSQRRQLGLDCYGPRARRRPAGLRRPGNAPGHGRRRRRRRQRHDGPRADLCPQPGPASVERPARLGFAQFVRHEPRDQHLRPDRRPEDGAGGAEHAHQRQLRVVHRRRP